MGELLTHNLYVGLEAALEELPHSELELWIIL
jgi:hypothetical protein